MGILIISDRFTFNPKFGQFGNGGFHIFYIKCQMSQPAGFRTADPPGRIGFCEDLQFDCAGAFTKAQIQFPVLSLLPVIFSDDLEAKFVDLEIFCGLYVGYDDSDMMNQG